MNKNTFHYITELGWLLLALMPIIVYFCMASAQPSADMITFVDMMSTKLQFTSANNVIYSTIWGVFGTGGTLPILTEGLAAYLTYYIIIELAHLVVDVLIFIPRLAQGWISSFTRRKHENYGIYKEKPDQDSDGAYRPLHGAWRGLYLHGRDRSANRLGRINQ